MTSISTHELFDMFQTHMHTTHDEFVTAKPSIMEVWDYEALFDQDKPIEPKDITID